MTNHTNGKKAGKKTDPDDDGPYMVSVSAKDRVGTIGVAEDGTVRKVVPKDDKDDMETTGKKYLKWISDCPTYVHTEIINKKCEREFVLLGKGAKDQHEVQFTVTSAILADNKKFKTEIINAYGSANRVGQLDYETVQKMTCNTRLVKQIGIAWVDNNLVLPGWEPEGYQCVIDDRLCFNMPDNLDLNAALRAHKSTLETWGFEKTLPVHTMMMGSPVLGGYYPEDRYGIMLQGITNSGKTQFAVESIAVYGADNLKKTSTFELSEDGDTIKYVLDKAEEAGPMPIIPDNFRPTKKYGIAKLAGFIHNLLGGSSRGTMTQQHEARATVAYRTTPLLTGEDYPADTATGSRVMVSNWPKPDWGLHDKTLDDRYCLPAIGRAWLLWLQTDDGQKFIQQIAAKFPEKRSEYQDALNKDTPAANRVGQNLAYNWMIWEGMCQHPTLGPFYSQYKREYEDGIEKFLKSVAIETKKGSEAERIVEMMLDRLHRDLKLWKESLDYHMGYRDTVIGWDDAEHLYIFPDELMKQVGTLRLTQELSGEAIGKQLFQLGYIERGDDGHTTKLKRYPGTKQGKRVWWFIKEAIGYTEPDKLLSVPPATPQEEATA